MKIKVWQKDLEKALSKVKGAVASNNTMPILRGIYVNHNTVLATDMELGIKTQYQAEVEEKGATVFPNNVVEIVKQLPKGKVSIEVKNHTAKIKCDNSEFELKCYNPDEFPQLPQVEDPKTLTLDNEKLKKAINKTKMAASNDETRPAMKGLHFSDEFVTATNTYRLSNYKVNIGIEELILPVETAKEIAKIDSEEVEIEYSDNYIKFKFDSETIISRLIEGKYPNWKQIMPSDYKTKVTANKRELKDALKRAKIVASDNNVVKVKADEKLEVIANADEGQAHEVLDANIEGEKKKINFDVGYLLDVIKVLENDEIELRLIDKLSPLMVVENNLKYLVMPVREG